MFGGGNEEQEKPRSEVRIGRGKAKSHLGQNMIQGRRVKDKICEGKQSRGDRRRTEET